ncbi:tryptophan-rich sensory protein [Porphyrobacter sp. TH134]|uniref:tryptophan-rich sensory protein n=1 Tax=Porphyrobacter sp. TH134 TaxID=2067450 RepID=UPI001F2E6E2D|nr:TspO/MBR family protein [Porphyrobacter sp. TH134]
MPVFMGAWVEQPRRKGNGICAAYAYMNAMDWTPALIAAAWAIILGGAGGVLTDIGPWYRDLKKPSWQPPDWLFGPAWTLMSMDTQCYELRRHPVLRGVSL